MPCRKHRGSLVLPGAVQIAPEIEADDLDRMRPEFCRKRFMQAVRRRCRNLVLDGDVRLPFLHVLSAQPGHEGRPQSGMDALKFRARNREGNAGAKMAKAAGFSADRRLSGRGLFQSLDNRMQKFARQAMEHRQMRVQKISIGRKMCSAQAIERFEIGLQNARSQNKRLERFQDIMCPCIFAAAWSCGFGK